MVAGAGYCTPAASGCQPAYSATAMRRGSGLVRRGVRWGVVAGGNIKYAAPSDCRANPESGCIYSPGLPYSVTLGASWHADFEGFATPTGLRPPVVSEKHAISFGCSRINLLWPQPRWGCALTGLRASQGRSTNPWL